MKKFLVVLSLVPVPLAALPAAIPTVLPIAAQAAAASKLGDLTQFETIANDTLALVDKGDLTAAKARITDFETAWDKAQHQLYSMDKTEWGTIDDAADGAIASLRKGKPSQAKAKAAVGELISALKNPAGK